jgi:hypothetical protein
MAARFTIQAVVYLIINGNSSLQNMQGLSSLVRVGATLFRISGNSSLESLDGLESLQTVIGDLIIEDNNALKNIDGLVGLTTAGAIGLINNGTLADISGLSNLQTVKHWFEIKWNPMLTDLEGLTALTTVGIAPAMSFLAIASNETLNTLDGLSAIQEVQNLIIEDNPSLAVICYQNNGSQAALLGSILRPQESAFLNHR